MVRTVAIRMTMILGDHVQVPGAAVPLATHLVQAQPTQPMGWKKMPPAAVHRRPTQPIGQPAVPVSDDEEDDD